MARRLLGLVLIVTVLAVIGGNLGVSAAAPAPLADAQAVGLVGGEIDCGTLLGATMAAAFLAGWGAITLIPAVIGGVGLVVFC